jgi:hypothetical protein
MGLVEKTERTFKYCPCIGLKRAAKISFGFVVDEVEAFGGKEKILDCFVAARNNGID